MKREGRKQGGGHFGDGKGRWEGRGGKGIEVVTVGCMPLQFPKMTQLHVSQAHANEKESPFCAEEAES